MDCDIVLDQGVPIYGAIIDNWPTLEPFFYEIGYNAPSTLPQQQQRVGWLPLAQVHHRRLSVS